MQITKKEKTVSLTVTIPETVIRKLKSISKKTGQSVSAITRQIFEAELQTK